MLRLFRLTGSTQDGSNKRWAYEAKLLGPKSGAGYAGSWPDSTIDTTTYTLYSLAEKINGSSGTYGNGLNQADLDKANASGANFDIGPIPDDEPVAAMAVYLDDGTLEWWIIPFPNGVPGNCDGI